MKLKNKKTGEIVEPFGITCINGRTFVQFADGKGTFKFEAHSLTELNANWEDFEEPKEYWHIFGTNITKTQEGLDKLYDKRNKEIGNYFETKEEAEKAVEKLKAWKRLKDNGFTFYDWVWDYTPIQTLKITASIAFHDGAEEDLDLLFCPEENS